MNKRIWILAYVVFLATGLSARQSVGALAVDTAKVRKIKSAFLLNFIKFAKWSAAAYPSNDSPIVIVVLGHDPLGQALDLTMLGQKVEGRRIEVRRLKIPQVSDAGRVANDATNAEKMSQFISELRASHLVFISSSEEPDLPRILNWVADSNVLTVSDIPNFAKHGGMFGLSIRRQRVMFDANPEALATSRVMVSSKILKLANLVETDRRGAGS